jgi:hypothetical protein
MDEPDSVLDCFNAQSPKLLKVVLHGFELFGRVLIRDLTRDPTGSKLALKPSSIARLNDEPRVFCVGSVVLLVRCLSCGFSRHRRSLPGHP